MIKNFENFVNDSETVNEGFLDNVMAGIDAGIGAFKASRNAEKAADEELSDILNGRSDEFSNKVKMTALVKQLVERTAILADGFSYDKLAAEGFSYDKLAAGRVNDDRFDLDIMLTRMKKIDDVISGLKALMIEDFNVKF